MQRPSSVQGIYVDSKGAIDKYAASIGKTSTDLTNAQKSQAVLNAVLAKGQSISGAFAAQLKTPQGALRALKVSAHEVTVELGMSLVKALTPAFAGLAKLGHGFQEAIAPGGKLAPIIAAIGSVATRLAAPVGAFFTKISNAFARLKPGTINQIAEAIKRFGPALAGVGAASALFTGAGLLDKLPVIGPMMTSLLGPIKSLVGGLGGLKGALGFLTGPVGIILTIFTTLMAVSPAFRTAVMGLVRTLLTALMPVFKSLVVALKPLLPIIVMLAKMLGQVLAPVVKALTPLLIALMPLVVLLAQLLTTLIGLVVKLITPALKLYLAFEKWYIINALLPLIRILTSVLTFLVRIITDVVKWIMGGSPGLIPAFNALMRVVTSVTNTISRVVVIGFTAIRNAIQAAWRFIQNTSIATWNAIRNAVTSAIRAVVNSVSNGVGTLVNLWSRGWNALVNTEQTIGRQLISAGQSAIRNLLSGMAQAIAGIGSWVKSHIVDPVVNAVKHFFGIHSPSTVMAEAGRNVTAGFIQGLVSSNPLAMAKTVFGGIPNALAGLVTKGIVGIGALPAKALGALGKVGGFFKGALTKIGGIFGNLFGGGGSGVGQWAGIMHAVLSHFGIPQLFGTFMAQMQTESGGNKNAINLWDSNAKAGMPSQGLMQVIPPTFAAYAGPYRSRGILDPLANIYAAVTYAISRYGSSIGAVLGHGHGYATGGVISEPITGFGHRSGHAYFFGERGPELVSPLTGPGATGLGKASPVVVNVYPRQHQSEVEIAAAVSRRLGWAMATGHSMITNGGHP